MQRNVNLGMSLGQLLSQGFSGQNRLKGVMDGTDIAYKNSQIDKAKVETAAKQQELDNRSDLGLVKSLTAGIQNEGNDNVLNDALNYMKGSYKPREIMGVTQDGSSLGNMPKPSYLDRFPELAQKFSTLKQQLALGDKDITHTSKAMQGDQRNAITANVGDMTDPLQIALAAQKASVLESNVNPLESTKAALTLSLANGANPKQLDALTASFGKGLYENSANGTYALNTGKETINPVGESAIAKNDAITDRTKTLTPIEALKIDAQTGLYEAQTDKANNPVEDKPTYDSKRGLYVYPDGRAVPVTMPDGSPLPANQTKTQLSAIAQKELFEAEDTYNSSINTVDMLKSALELNKKAYSGIGAKPRAIAASNVPFVQSESADATIELDNLMTGQALESLKAVFGGMPTEGERKILLDIQASADKTPVQRQAIINRAIEMANRRLKTSEEKMKLIRSGTYFDEQSGVAPEQPAQSGIVKVKSKAEALKLPVGTQFYTPDGRLMVR